MASERTCPCGRSFPGLGVHCRKCLLESMRAAKERGGLLILIPGEEKNHGQD